MFVRNLVWDPKSFDPYFPNFAQTLLCMASKYSGTILICKRKNGSRTNPAPAYWPVDCIRAESPENEKMWTFLGFGEFVCGFDIFTGKISPVPTFLVLFLLKSSTKTL